MNSRGFTLIELMAVVTILVIVSLVIIPIVDVNIKKSKNEMYSIQIENIRMAGQNYFSDNINLKPGTNSSSFVTLDLLVSNEYIDEVTNPKTGRPFSENIYVQLLNRNGSFYYLVCPFDSDCEPYN